MKTTSHSTGSLRRARAWIFVIIAVPLTVADDRRIHYSKVVEFHAFCARCSRYQLLLPNIQTEEHRRRPASARVPVGSRLSVKSDQGPLSCVSRRNFPSLPTSWFELRCRPHQHHKPGAAPPVERLVSGSPPCWGRATILIRVRLY